jgi:DNA-binding transcriptional ArsR family regulator
MLYFNNLILHILYSIFKKKLNWFLLYLCNNAFMKKLHHPSINDIKLSVILQALSDSTRLDIIKQLDNEGPRTCGTFDLKIAKSSASHHFRVLRESGLILMEQDGVKIMNKLRKDEINELFPGLLDIILKAPKERV